MDGTHLCAGAAGAGVHSWQADREYWDCVFYFLFFLFIFCAQGLEYIAGRLIESTGIVSFFLFFLFFVRRGWSI